MNNRIMNTFPWGLHFNHKVEPLNPGYKYTCTAKDEDSLRRKRIKIFDTNVPDLIPMDIVLEEEQEEEQGLVKQQRKLPPLRMDTDTASESESEEEEDDMPAMPVLRRQTTCWINEEGITAYNGCPFGNRLMNK
jgi:hypothetical protein